MSEPGVNQGVAYDGYTASATYDSTPQVPKMTFDAGQPATNGDQPGTPQDEPTIIERKKDG